MYSLQEKSNMTGLGYFVSTITFVTLVLSVKQSSCSERSELNPQIKIVGAQYWYVNPEYHEGLIFRIKKHNDTYNNVGVHWRIVQDMPRNSLLGTKIYITDNAYQNEKLIFENLTPLCGPSKYRDLLQLHLMVDEDNHGDSCIEKSIIDLDDLGQFRFEVLVPNIGDLGDYYRIDYTFGTVYESYVLISFYAEWGYLNSD